MLKAIIIAAVLLAIIGMFLVIACCKVAGKCSREEERKEREKDGPETSN